MNISKIYLRFKHLFFRSKAELEEIRDETGMMGETYFSLFVLCFIVGLSNARSELANLISETAIWYTSTLIATFATWLLAPRFGAVSTWAKALKVNVFMVFPMLICVALANILTYRIILLLIGAAYSVYLLYFGIKIVLTPKGQMLIPYTTIVLLVAMLANYIARVLIP